MTEAANSFEPVKRRRAFEDILLQIEDAIHEGRLQVGDRLPPERELAEIFQVSRASVREALRVLEVLGVVTARQGTGADSGSIVSANDASPLSGLLRLHASLRRMPLTDLVEVREALETLTSRKAAERAGAPEVETLRGIIEDMRHCESPEDFLTLDTQFHMTVAQMSGNALAPLMMGALRDAIARQMLNAFRELERAGTWDTERATLVVLHAELVEPIEHNDPDEASRAFTAHVQDFYERVYPDVVTPTDVPVRGRH
jgi:DNA-binding FadR family transcriptional regulator